MATTVHEGMLQALFLNEVKSMMYIFGDIKTSSNESALLVESVALRQTRDTVKRASGVSCIRNGANITVTDILFLYRNDKAKLKRLIQHIELRDICRRTSSSLEDGTHLDNGGLKKENFVLSFLSKSDQDEVLSDQVDEVQQKRLESFDSITKDMNMSEYKEFSESRQANFHKNLTKFKEWLDLPVFLPSVKLSQDVYTILGYIAYYVVQEIVELALVIKLDQEGVASDPTRLSHCIDNTIDITPPNSPRSPGGSSSLSSPTQTTKQPKPRKRGRPPKNSTSSTVSDHVTVPTAPPTALQPFHILEATRRYSVQLVGPCVPMKTYF